MDINIDRELENKIVEIYKIALTDMSTQIEFFKKFEGLDDVSMLRYKNNIILLYKVVQPAFYLSFSKKWDNKFKKLKKQIEDYNNLIGNALVDSNPIYFDIYSEKYDKIIENVSKKNTKINRFFYGEPWVKKQYDKPTFHIKFNQISISINYETYQEFLLYSLNIEKQKTILRLDELLNKLSDKIQLPKKAKNSKSQTTNLSIDYILDKISKTGLDSLTEEEKTFLKKGSKDINE